MFLVHLKESGEEEDILGRPVQKAYQFMMNEHEILERDKFEPEFTGLYRVHPKNWCSELLACPVRQIYWPLVAMLYYKDFRRLKRLLKSVLKRAGFWQDIMHEGEPNYDKQFHSWELGIKFPSFFLGYSIVLRLLMRNLYLAPLFIPLYVILNVLDLVQLHKCAINRRDPNLGASIKASRYFPTIFSEAYKLLYKHEKEPIGLKFHKKSSTWFFGVVGLIVSVSMWLYVLYSAYLFGLTQHWYKPIIG